MYQNEIISPVFMKSAENINRKQSKQPLRLNQRHTWLMQCVIVLNFTFRRPSQTKYHLFKFLHNEGGLKFIKGSQSAIHKLAIQRITMY